MKRQMLIALFCAMLMPGMVHAAGCSPKRPEPVAPFLNRFSTEPAFAVRRTVLPLQRLKWEYGANANGEDESAAVKSLITRQDYLRWPPLDSAMKSNNLTSAIERQTATEVVLKIFQQDTDWLTLYHFRLQNGCWFLWQFEDQSL